MAVYQSLSVSQVSQNLDENTSQVRILWQSTQSGGSYNLVEHTASYWISVNGQPEQIYTVTYNLPRHTAQAIVDTVVTVRHNEKGEASVQVRTWMDTHISAGVVELSQTLVADKIPRASTLMATDAVIGGFSRLAVTKRSADYTHSIAWQFGEQSGFVTESGEVSGEEVIFSADRVDFVIPESFYEAIPNAKSGVCRLTVCTYCDSVPVGQPQTAAITVTVEETVCCPLVGGTVADSNDITAALTGDRQVLVRYCSDALCTAQTQARKGASIVKTRIQGVEAENTLTIPGFDARSVSFEAEDSRGCTAVYTQPVTLIPYVRLTCEAVAEREDPVSGNAVLQISGDCYHGSFGAAENVLTVTYRIDDGEKISLEPSVTEDDRFFASAELTGMDYTRLYSITVWVSDCLGTVEKRTVLKKGVPVFDWGENDFAFHVPVRMEHPLGVEYGGTGASDDKSAWVNLGLTIPMEPGTEYPTWQRWNGKTVYTKVVEIPQMPNADCIGINHWAAAAQVIGCRGSMSDGRSLPWGGSHTERADIFCDREKVYLDTQGDCSQLSAAVQIYYIKEEGE